MSFSSVNEQIGRHRWTICALIFAATTINYLDRNVLGLQCHLETDAAEIEAWLVGHSAELIASGRDPRAIRADAERFGPELHARSIAVLDSWIEGWQ